MTELVASPLLIRRVRNPGGTGGRRLRVLVGGDGGFELVVEATGHAASRTAYADEVAVVHAYNAELRRAARAGLTSRPEPAELSVGQLRARAAAMRR